MNRGLVSGLVTAVVISAAVLLALALGNDRPQGISRPVALKASVAAGPLGLAGPTCAVIFTVPGKQWGGVWHWSPAILRPAKLERVCVTYPGVGTLATVTLINP